MNILRTIARGLDFAGDPRVWSYLLRSKKPSLASYRACQAMSSLMDRPPGTVFDVGANQGQFAGAAAWWFPGSRIISFEPSPGVFKTLRENTRQIPGIRLVESAVGDREGEITFFESAYSHASSALPANETLRGLRPDAADTRPVTVPVTTLDAFARGRQWPGPIFLKLDVQGFEKKVLEGAGAFLERVDYLLFECSYRALYEGEPVFSEMYSYVASLGFDLVAPVGFLEDESHVMLQADLLWRRR